MQTYKIKNRSHKENILETPNKETIKAMRVAEKGNVKKYKNSSEMLSELNKTLKLKKVQSNVSL